MRLTEQNAVDEGSDVSEGNPQNVPVAATSCEPRTTAPATDIAAAAVETPISRTVAASGNRSPLSVSSEALASIVRSLIASKEAMLQVQHSDDDEGPGILGGGPHQSVEEGEDEALYQEAIAMLQEELARLTEQMTTETDVAARIRQQVGGMAFDTRIAL